MEHNGIPTLCIGTLQGGKATLETNRIFTKEFWGLRPQNMALTALRWYARTIGIEQIFSIPADKLWSKKIKDRAAIAEFLQEQGATLVVNSPFVKLKLENIQKDLSDIPTRKRSMYKKRYEFLDRLQTKFTTQIQTYIYKG